VISALKPAKLLGSAVRWIIRWQLAHNTAKSAERSNGLKVVRFDEPFSDWSIAFYELQFASLTGGAVELLSVLRSCTVTFNLAMITVFMRFYN
jgi:hypothetical protein